MKVILYMATTANGYIAKKNHETPWSEEEWESYADMVNSVGNIIIGWDTYEIMKDDQEFQKIGNPFTVVLTHKKIESSSNFAFVNSPSEALELLKNKGFKETLIAGGSKLNSSFFKENLIDEMYLDIEPFIFGSGINLFSDIDFDTKLKLLKTKHLSDETIQLHYSIVK